ncbi:transposase, partial [Teladorsagia circumcincta]
DFNSKVFDPSDRNEFHSRRDMEEAHHSEGTVNRSTVGNWYKRFAAGDTSLEASAVDNHEILIMMNCYEVSQRTRKPLRLKSRDSLADLETGDESWLMYDNNKGTAVWLPRGAEPSTQTKPNPHQRKHLLSVWWDMKGPVYYELLHAGKTVTAAVYIDQLQHLADVFRENAKDDRKCTCSTTTRAHTSVGES